MNGGYTLTVSTKGRDKYLIEKGGAPPFEKRNPVGMMAEDAGEQNGKQAN